MEKYKMIGVHSIIIPIDMETWKKLKMEINETDDYSMLYEYTVDIPYWSQKMDVFGDTQSDDVFEYILRCVIDTDGDKMETIVYMENHHTVDKQYNVEPCNMYIEMDENVMDWFYDCIIFDGDKNQYPTITWMCNEWDKFCKNNKLMGESK